MKDVPEESNARECNTRERSANAVEEPLAERIDGRIYIMRKPKRWHQRIVRILKEMIEEYRKKNPGLCEVRTAPFGLTLAGGGTTRSEERRVGKECRIGCRSRWSPYH